MFLPLPTPELVGNLKENTFVAGLPPEIYSPVCQKIVPSKGDGPSRNELMLAAKEKKIKNFRVMNKEELAEVLKSGTTVARIKQIEEGAVKRWKSGWSDKNAE